MPSNLSHEINIFSKIINNIINNNNINYNKILIIGKDIRNNLSKINNNYEHITYNTKLINNKVNKNGDTITGEIKIITPNINSIMLGDATHEGGDLKIYRNTMNDLALSFDADAISNALALSVYGGVVAQNYLTVGKTTLDTYAPLYVQGNQYTTGNIFTHGYLLCFDGKGILSANDNIGMLKINISISGTDSIDHAIKTQIDSNDIIVAQATGDGAGGITNPAIGLYPGTTPTIQAAHIADPTENIAANNAAIDAILVALRNIGILASS